MFDKQQLWLNDDWFFMTGLGGHEIKKKKVFSYRVFSVLTVSFDHFKYLHTRMNCESLL